MSETLLARARAGDRQAFDEILTPMARELHVHCYRLLGSVHDADDALQETLLAAWRGLGSYEGRGSLRGWLYQIATNRSLNAIRDNARRSRPQIPTPPFEPPAPSSHTEPCWLEPYPDVTLVETMDADMNPEARYQTREAIELAFMTALRRLPARQRAVVLLRDALGFHTDEVASMLECSQAAVKSALQRARAALEERDRRHAPPPTSAERELVRRFADAFESDDIAGVVALLTDDALLWMPPASLEYRGRIAVASFLTASAEHRGRRRFRLLPTRANGQPGFGLYVDDAEGDVAEPAGLVVLTLQGEAISTITRFLDTGLPGAFALPLRVALKAELSDGVEAARAESARAEG